MMLVTWPHGHRPKQNRRNWPPELDHTFPKACSRPGTHHLSPSGIKGLESLPGVDCWTSTSLSLSFHIRRNEDRSNVSKEPLQIGVGMNVSASGGCEARASKLTITAGTPVW